MPPVARPLIAIALGGAAALGPPTRSSAEGVTLEIPAEAPGGPLRRRVERVLPPHVGCAVLVIGEDASGEAVDFRAGYGRVGLADDAARVTPRTNFRVASFSKVLTALAVLRLADAGKLSLDDPVTRWLAGMPEWAQRCTLGSMLDHTSGVAAYHGLIRPTRVVGGPAARFTDLNVFNAVASAPPQFRPGGDCRYSNSAYVLLGLVVQQATVDPMHVALRQWALRPAGMARSEVLVPALNPVEDRAYGHRPGELEQRVAQIVQQTQLQLNQFRELQNRRDLPAAQLNAFKEQVARLEARLERFAPPPELAGAEWHVEDQSEYSELGGDGALYTSVDDLAALIRAVMERGPLLSEASWRLWTAPQSTPPPGDGFGDSAAGRRFACGWVVDDRTGETRLSHRGETRGFRQTVQVFPDSGRAVAVLMNNAAIDVETGADWTEAQFERLGERVMRGVLGPIDTVELEPEVTAIEETTDPFELRRDADR
ncbi:MAG: serine hydrolase domain-containing protein [Planctomycetota bacterium]